MDGIRTDFDRSYSSWISVEDDVQMMLLFLKCVYLLLVVVGIIMNGGG